jgi:hypothetical protein
MKNRRLALAAVLVFLLCRTVTTAADCGVTRWPVKVAADRDTGQISSAVIPTTIEALRALPTRRPLPQDRRVSPVETTIYSVIATLTDYRLSEDGDIHLVLTDQAGRTIIGEIPAPTCVGGSRFATEIGVARQRLSGRLLASEFFKRSRIPVEVRGVGFFDFMHSQRGLAPNGIELHPVTYISFAPLFDPTPPPATTSRRRAARSPGPGLPTTCVIPTLAIAASRANACEGETVTVSWQASDPQAAVSIDGVGSFLPSSGNATVSVSVATAFSGRARNTCGLGDESVAVVNVQPPSTASLFGPSAVTQGSSGTLSFSISGATSWTLTSSLGNPISPSSGGTSGIATYTGIRSGTDVVTLRATGGTCGVLERSITIVVSTPPSTGGLLCCDGTRSPTCFSCSNKQGCCSSHKGVCGCSNLVDDPDDEALVGTYTEDLEALSHHALRDAGRRGPLRRWFAGFTTREGTLLPCEWPAGASAAPRTISALERIQTEGGTLTE